jgi:hypothetical protein
MIDTSSEEHRHRCEVRWCIKQGPRWFAGYLKEVEKARGHAAAMSLQHDVRKQAAAGNAGASGDWRDDT